MSANPAPSPKRPRDYFPWIYWLLFLLVVPVVAIWMANKPTRVSLPLPNQNLSPYHVIMSNDVSMKWVDKNNVTVDTVHDMQNLIGHFTLTPILANQPIRENQIGPKPDPPSLILNTLAVAIPVNSATIIGGNLRAGDVVSMAVVPLSNTTSMPTIVFETILVLDVKSTGDQTVIVLAIPANRWLDYLTKIRNATVVLARQIQ